MKQQELNELCTHRFLLQIYYNVHTSIRHFCNFSIYLLFYPTSSILYMFLLHMIFDHTRFVYMYLMKTDFLKQLKVCPMHGPVIK